MLNRDTQSNFLDNISISERGIVKVAASQVPGKLSAVTEQKVKKVLKVLKPKHKDLVERHEQQLELGAKPQDVAKSILTGLTSGKQSMCLTAAMTLRQAGMFKVAGRDVYEDLETGEFWKISEDKKNVVRLFKEDEKGIADKRASRKPRPGNVLVNIEFSTDREDPINDKRESKEALKAFIKDFKAKFGEEPEQNDEDQSPFLVEFEFTPEQFDWVEELPSGSYSHTEKIASEKKLPEDLIGKKYVVTGLKELGDNEIKHSFGEENVQKIKSYDGKEAKVLSIETATDESEITHTYFNVKFDDGFEIQGLSGYHFAEFRKI